MKFNVAVLGAGKIGETIAQMLLASGDYSIRLGDIDEKRLSSLLKEGLAVETFKINPEEKSTLNSILSGTDAVISALPYWCNIKVAEVAKENNIHYFDLTEDVEITKAVSMISQSATSVFMPQAGLAPGFISVVANDLAKSFDSLEHLKLRVGALPLFPTNKLRYALTWSTDGLVNEYINPCEAIVNGKKSLTKALDGYEVLTINGLQFEAFNTSGGAGSLCDTYLGKITNLDYKTIRYPGHRDLVQFLLEDLNFNEKKSELVKILNESLPLTKQDQCVVFVEVIGIKDGQRHANSYANFVKHGKIGKKEFSAIQLSTSSGVCVPLDLVLTKKINKNKGLLLAEEIKLSDFFSNRFSFPYQN